MAEYATVIEVWFEADGLPDAQKVATELGDRVRAAPDVRLVEVEEPEEVG